MKYISIPLIVLMVFAAVFAAFTPAKAGEADGQWLSFVTCTNDVPGNVEIGMDQLFVHVEDLHNGQVRFNFTNLGPEASSITQIYFQDGTILGPVTIQNGPGVLFEEVDLGDKDPVLPGANNCPGGAFNPTRQLLVASVEPLPPVQPNGVNPDEWLGTTFNITGGNTFDSILAQLISGQLRIAFHVQGYADGGSEAFVNNGFTAVSLQSFQAKATRGQIALNWVTGAEINNAGFNLYRSATFNGPRVQVNSGLLAASAGAASGASYKSMDAPGYGTFFYWLEDVDYSGFRTLHGPVKVTVAPSVRGPLFRPQLLGNH